MLNGKCIILKRSNAPFSRSSARQHSIASHRLAPSSRYTLRRGAMTRRLMQILLPSKQEHLITRPMLLGDRNIRPRQLSSGIVIPASLLVFFPSPTSSSQHHPCPYSSNNYTTHCQSSSASLKVPSIPPPLVVSQLRKESSPALSTGNA